MDYKYKVVLEDEIETVEKPEWTFDDPIEAWHRLCQLVSDYFLANDIVILECRVSTANASAVVLHKKNADSVDTFVTKWSVERIESENG